MALALVRRQPPPPFGSPSPCGGGDWRNRRDLSSPTGGGGAHPVLCENGANKRIAGSRCDPVGGGGGAGDLGQCDCRPLEPVLAPAPGMVGGNEGRLDPRLLQIR